MRPARNKHPRVPEDLRRARRGPHLTIPKRPPLTQAMRCLPPHADTAVAREVDIFHSSPPVTPRRMIINRNTKSGSIRSTRETPSSTRSATPTGRIGRRPAKLEAHRRASLRHLRNGRALARRGGALSQFVAGTTSQFARHLARHRFRSPAYPHAQKIRSPRTEAPEFESSGANPSGCPPSTPSGQDRSARSVTRQRNGKCTVPDVSPAGFAFFAG